jgi:purine-binding chemotaxis protein CheW
VRYRCASKFGQPKLAYTDKTCIIIVVVGEIQAGLIVDSVAEVVSADPASLMPPPESCGSTGANYLHSITSMGNKVIFNIDCDKFFGSDLQP